MCTNYSMHRKYSARIALCHFQCITLHANQVLLFLPSPTVTEVHHSVNQRPAAAHVDKRGPVHHMHTASLLIVSELS